MKNKKIILAAMYVGALALIVMVSSSCDDGPITPNDPVGNGVDTTWVDPYDTTGTGGGCPNDTTGSPNDTIGG